MTDIIIDTEDGTITKDGDLNIGVSDRQNQGLLISCQKGSFKQFPATCVGASNYLEGEDQSDFVREVRRQLVADGMTVTSIKIENDKLKVDASY